MIEIDGERVGLVASEERADVVFLAEIQIDPAHQNRGIGSRVLTDVLAKARAVGKPAELQVLKGSPAREWYSRYGFEVVGETDTHLSMRSSSSNRRGDRDA